MFCENCGKKLDMIMKFCPCCGERVIKQEKRANLAENNIENKEEQKRGGIVELLDKLPERPSIRKRMMWGFIFSAIIFLLTKYFMTAVACGFASLLLSDKIYYKCWGIKKVFLYIGVVLCFGIGIVSFQIKELGDKYISSIQKGTFKVYTNEKIGDTFENFFDDTQWIYFVSDNGKDIVEFTGKCWYDGEKVDVLMQFTIDDDGEFEVTYLSFDEVAQSELELAILLESVFSGESDDDDSVSKNSKENDGVKNIEYVKQYFIYGIDYTIGELFDSLELDAKWSYKKEGNREFVTVTIQEYEGEVEVIFIIGESPNDSLTLYDVLLNGESNIELFNGFNTRLFGEKELGNIDDEVVNEDDFDISDNTEIDVVNDRWYIAKGVFYSASGDTRIEIGCMNDVMLDINFYVGTESMGWVIDASPKQVKDNGDLVYYDDGSFILTYSAEDGSIYVDTSDGLFEGKYISVDEFNEYIGEYNDNNAMKYAGAYVGYGAYNIVFSAYTSIVDDEIGIAEIYYNGELVSTRSVYLCRDKGDWENWEYDQFYVMYCDGYNEYLGFYEENGVIMLDYNGSSRNLDILVVVERYES